MPENNITPIVPNKRAIALDALRGFAILMMILSGTIRYKILPAWMYHAQEPPPNHNFNPNLAGLTWVDLVFPIFLFAMGAAIPLALSRRLEQGFSKFQTIIYILKRGLLLGIFAILLQHLRPQVINPKLDSNIENWLIALFGFLLLFLMFVRWPSWGKFGQYRQSITIGAWLTAIILMPILRYPPKGTGFALERSDIILIVLANMAVFGSLIWLFTRFNLWLRVGFIPLLLALRLSSTVDNSWIKLIWSKSPVPWIFQPDYLKYLFIVIPGTIAGDLILTWLKTSAADNYEIKNESKQRFYLIITLMLTICLVLLIGLQSRLVWQTSLISGLLCSFGWWLFNKPANSTDNLIKSLYQWGTYLLILGLLFEPFQGGIKKDPSTISYYFITTAIAFFLLIVLLIFIDILNQLKWFQLLIDNGQNPLIGYVLFANLIWPISTLTGLEDAIIKYTNNPFMGFMKGLITTLVIGYIVSLFTKLKLFWKM